ncbi:EAL domain-containing protein [Vibrio alginolyticus]
MRAFSKLVHDVSQLNDFLVTFPTSSDKQYLVQILSTQSREITTTLADAVLSSLPNAHVMGHSTRNVILEGEIFTSGCLVSVIEFEQTTLTSAVQTYSYSPDIDGGELKRSLLMQHNSQVILSFAVQIERRDYPLFQTFASEEVVMIFNCASRLDFIDSSDEVQAFKDIATTFGSYCMGELHGGIGQPEILHHSLTYLAMREGDEVQTLNLPKSPVSSSISPLFSLIRNAIGDLNHMNAHMGYQLDRQTRKLQESYRRDSRTGLQNRVALQERLSNIDLDEHLLTLKLLNFSHINEKYGYRVGDQLLKDLSMHFTNRLRKRFGMPTALQLYSIGVGEWAFIFKADQSSETIKQHFTRFADAVEQTNFEPIGLREIDYLSISLCGGLVSRRDFPSASVDELLLKGIEARRSGVRSNTHICNAKDIEVSEDVRKEQLGWLSCVSRAILKQNIITYSQPIVHAGSHKLASQECLVRILEADGTVIAPGRFLPIISDTHLYTRLSRHMIHSTLHYMRDKQGDFSINLSPQDLLSDKTLMLLEHEISQLNDPRRIGLEVLESEQIKDYGRMIEVCSHFRSLGARIIVDDFGSGYSNIDEILKLEPEVIKLDGSLIRDIDKDLKQRKIASQLVRLCQVFNAETVAEFVHNQEVCTIAQDMGVDYLQGYYLGEPTRLF